MAGLCKARPSGPRNYCMPKSRALLYRCRCRCRPSTCLVMCVACNAPRPPAAVTVTPPSFLHFKNLTLMAAGHRATPCHVLRILPRSLLHPVVYPPPRRSLLPPKKVFAIFKCAHHRRVQAVSGQLRPRLHFCRRRRLAARPVRVRSVRRLRFHAAGTP